MKLFVPTAITSPAAAVVLKMFLQARINVIALSGSAIYHAFASHSDSQTSRFVMIDSNFHAA
jgi:predicted membrane channel-forming protein YqfA (hemolysin III family)